MSAQVSLKAATKTAVPARPLSLGELSEGLQSAQSLPSLKELYALLECARFSQDELRPYIGFKPGNYSRHRVCRNQFAEMLVLCWKPGHRTPIHDHNGSHGYHSYLRSAARSAEDLQTGQPTY